MSIARHILFIGHAAFALLAGTLVTGCSEDGTVANPNIDYTDSYKVEYVPGMMDSMQGKTEFQIAVSDKTTGDAVTGATVMLMPLMYMTDKTHSTPVDNGGACNESGTAGTYDCTVFYVMSDDMGGYWELEVKVTEATTESVKFSPAVGMAMGDTAMVKQYNSNLTMNMMGDIKLRTFQVFKSSLTGTTGDHTFEVFTSTMEEMMSFPAVYDGVILNSTTPNELVIGTPNPAMTVRVSTQSDFAADTHDAISDGTGHWTATGIQGLVDGNEGTLYVEVTINGNTLNSDALNGTPGIDYATFTVTPKSSM